MNVFQKQPLLIKYLKKKTYFSRKIFLINVRTVGVLLMSNDNLMLDEIAFKTDFKNLPSAKTFV